MGKEEIVIERTTSRGLRRDAEDFFEAYKLVYAAHPDKNKWNTNLKLLKVKYYLASHALELYFKSVLLNKGVTLDILRNNIKHDLNKCLKLCQEKGLCIFDEQQELTIKQLNIYYKNKIFEYSQNGYLHLPNLSDVEGIISKLKEIIDKR